MMMTVCGSPPVLEPAEHDLDAVAPFILGLALFDGILVLFPVRDAGAYPFAVRRLSEAVGVISTITEQPVDLRREQRLRTDVVTDALTNRLSGRHSLSQMARVYASFK